MHQQYAEQIRSSVFFLFFFFYSVYCKGTKQHHSKEERNQYAVLTHLSPQGSREAPPAGRDDVCLCECDGVINCMSRVSVRTFKAAYMQISSIWLYIGKHAGWYDIYVLYVCPSMCVISWAASGVIVPGAFVDDRCLQTSLALLDFPADQRL